MQSSLVESVRRRKHSRSIIMTSENTPRSGNNCRRNGKIARRADWGIRYNVEYPGRRKSPGNGDYTLCMLWFLITTEGTIKNGEGIGV